jgi:hypothetical protein
MTRARRVRRATMTTGAKRAMTTSETSLYYHVCYREASLHGKTR